MTSLRLVVAGVGRAGLLHAINAHRWLVATELAGVIDSDTETARRIGADLGVPWFGSLEAAIEREPFQAVVITTPTFTHRDLAIVAAQAGKHVFCEKPMSLTVADCELMIDAAQAAGICFQMGFVRRFQAEFIAAKHRIDAGAIGEPMIVKSLTRGPGLPPPWARDLRLSNGMLAEVNSHDFDSARWLAGSEIVRVYTEVANLKSATHQVTAADFYDNAVVTLRFGSGALGTIDGTCPAGYGYDARVEVVGTEGVLVIGELRSVSLLEVRGETKGAGSTPTYSSWPERFESGYRAELQAFADAIRSGTTPLVTAEDGRAAVAAVTAANRSWAEGRPVSVDAVVSA